MKLFSMMSALIVSAVLVVAAYGAEKKYEKKFTVNPGATFTVRADVGSVSVEGGNTKEVSILVKVEGRQRDLDPIDISASQTASGVELRLRNNEKAEKWFNWGNSHIDAQIAVTVPRDQNLSLSTAGGNIEIKHINGRVGGGTSGGNLELNDIAGTVELQTSGGDIRASNVTGQLTMETSGGNITIKDVKGDVDVNTSGGNVMLNSIVGRIRAETSGGNIAVTVKESNKGVHAETSGGNIDLMLPKGISATVDATTSGGEVTCDFPITMQGKLDESRIRGTINGGGNKIYAHTSGGSIRIRGIE